MQNRGAVSGMFSDTSRIQSDQNHYRLPVKILITNIYRENILSKSLLRIYSEYIYPEGTLEMEDLPDSMDLPYDEVNIQ